jgi:aminoglycoside 6'-N-acetyltransferase
VTLPAINFRPLDRWSFAVLATWLDAPHVKMWWPDESDPASIEARYGPVVDGADPSEVFLIEREDAPIGLIQRYRFSDNPEWQTALAPAGTPREAAGIDYFIGVADLIGLGLGPVIIDRFVRDTWARYPDIEAVVVSVQAENRRSWRALEKCGFRRAWSGTLASDDPSDQGTSHVYVLYRSHPVQSG